MDKLANGWRGWVTDEVLKTIDCKDTPGTLYDARTAFDALYGAFLLE
jgi:hypothetical protein